MDAPLKDRPMKSHQIAALLFSAFAATTALAQQESSQASFYEPPSSQSSFANPPTATQTVPEPSSLPLVVLALVGAVGVARFIKRK